MKEAFYLLIKFCYIFMYILIFIFEKNHIPFFFKLQKIFRDSEKYEFMVNYLKYCCYIEH